MPSFDSDQLESDVQYLNLDEMRSFCSEHRLPLYIHVERADGSLQRTGDRDRKDVVLRRILIFAEGGRRTGPTVYRYSVVAEGPLLTPLSSRTRIRYGQYEKQNADLLERMLSLTGGEFRFGMIARLVLRDLWSAGESPTLKQLAIAWTKANAAHTEPRPEGAYLADLARGEAGPGWKTERVRRAKRALRTLASLVRRR